MIVTKLRSDASLTLCRSEPKLEGCTWAEIVIYNADLNTWERLMEPACEKSVPVKFQFFFGRVNMTEAAENIEDVPLVTEGM